jgi:putative hydrolase of the HAD superfamily
MLKLKSNKNISLPKAVVFDTDNTLYLYEPAHNAAMKNVVTKATGMFGVSKSEFMEAFEISRADIKERLGNSASSHSRLLYFQKTIEYLDMETRILSTLELEQTYWRSFLANTRLFPGVKTFLHQLKENGIRTANITDLTAQIQFRKMVYFSLDELFDYVVSSEESGVDKPNLRPFSLVVEKLQVDPSDIWIVGDNADTDILGGNLCGMTTIQKYHNGVKIVKDESHTPDIIFDNFYELSKFFHSLTVS